MMKVVSRIAEVPGDEAQHCGGEEEREGREEEEKDRTETDRRFTPPVLIIEQERNSEDPGQDYWPLTVIKRIMSPLSLTLYFLLANSLPFALFLSLSRAPSFSNAIMKAKFPSKNAMVVMGGGENVLVYHSELSL